MVISQLFRNSFRNLKRAPLVRRVCVYTFLFSFSLLVIAVYTQSASNYQFKREQVSDCLEGQIEKYYVPLSESIWNKNKKSILQILEDVERECSAIGEGPALFFWRVTTRDEGEWLQLGNSLGRGPQLDLSYPLNYWNEGSVGEFGIGELRLTYNLHQMLAATKNEALMVLLVHGLILMLGALFALSLGYVLFIRPARLFMDHAVHGDIDETLKQTMESGTTEIAQLWQVILRLRNDFDKKYDSSQQQRSKLEASNSKFLKELESKNQFISSLSHELRTPMNGLIGFSALLAETKLNSEQQEYVHTIQASLESLLHVINDVLDLSRIESGDLHVNSIPFSIRGLVSGVSSLLKVRAESKGVRFESRISPDIPQVLRGDPGRIRQILMNLVSNAIQHTEKGHVLINLEQMQQIDSRVLLRISIEDTGVEPSMRGRGNEGLLALGVSPFSSELRERRSINLNVCYSLAELLGAKIEFESSQELGTTYWLEISLPIIPLEEAPNLIDRTLASRLHVLVVDPSELSQRITLELLQGWGVSFEAVLSLKEALLVLREPVLGDSLLGHSLLGEKESPERVNLVLCDERANDGEGHDLCEQLRRCVDGYLGVVVLSNNPQLGDAEKYFLSGANGFLSKEHRDPFLRDVMCQVYSERDYAAGRDRRLVTRYTVTDVSETNTEYLNLQLDKPAILVVEDNIVNQQLVMRILEKRGCRVDIAANGFEAIELFKSNNYRLIFMDCLMPDMDGYETTQILREIEHSRPERTKVAIVALTASVMIDEDVRCFKAGMDDFMRKPINISELEMVLLRHIN